MTRSFRRKFKLLRSPFPRYPLLLRPLQKSHGLLGVGNLYRILPPYRNMRSSHDLASTTLVTSVARSPPAPSGNTRSAVPPAARESLVKAAAAPNHKPTTTDMRLLAQRTALRRRNSVNGNVARVWRYIS